MSGPLFSGSITALVTPFRNGAVDEEGFRKFKDKVPEPLRPASVDHPT